MRTLRPLPRCKPHMRGDEPESTYIDEELRQRKPHMRGDEPWEDLGEVTG